MNTPIPFGKTFALLTTLWLSLVTAAAQAAL
jgi:hypothetical protein